MARLPRVTAQEIGARLNALGFIVTRQKGSHRIYRNKQGRRVTVSFHHSEIIPPKTLKSIMRQAGIDIW